MTFIKIKGKAFFNFKFNIIIDQHKDSLRHIRFTYSQLVKNSITKYLKFS